MLKSLYEPLEWQLNNLAIIPNPLSFYPEEVSAWCCKTATRLSVHDRLFKSGSW
jgi:hypothetical protein